ncbi:MAG: hypothetical protein HZC54_14615 [Verrucomicrobia bacterium]|nr:hypothetical protein [Verrucomicrobiota bacterium]
MNSKEAKQILRCYRPGVGCEKDPQIAAALDEARRNPALGRWLQRELAFDEAVRAKLRAIPVPSDLRQRILKLNGQGRSKSFSRGAEDKPASTLW